MFEGYYQFDFTTHHDLSWIMSSEFVKVQVEFGKLELV